MGGRIFCEQRFSKDGKTRASPARQWPLRGRYSVKSEGFNSSMNCLNFWVSSTSPDLSPSVS